ncbi:MAG: hypothetical protein ACFB0D_10450 [Phormidesmis sp.]
MPKSFSPKSFSTEAAQIAIQEQRDTYRTGINVNRLRDNFREQFPHVSFVFVVPPFALKYFMYRFMGEGSIH